MIAFRALALLSAIAAALLAVACRKTTGNTQPIDSYVLSDVSGEVKFGEAPNAKIRVALLKTARERESAPGNAAFAEVGGLAQGLLHAYPVGSPALLRQKPSDIATEAAFLNDKGEVVAITSLPAWPREPGLTAEDVAKRQGFGNNWQQLIDNGLDPMIVLAFENRMSGAQTYYAGNDVRFALQAAEGWLAKAGVRLGSKATIAKELADATDVEPVLPTITFHYTPDAKSGDSPKLAHFNLRLAFTPAARDAYLSRGAILNQRENDAVLVAWPKERELSIHSRDLPAGIIIVPYNGGASINDTLVELRPEQRLTQLPPGNANVRPGDIESSIGREWEDKSYARNWEWQSPKPVRGFLMLRASAIYKLGLKRDDTIFAAFKTRFSAELPEWVTREPIAADANAIELELKPRERSVRLRVGLLDTNEARYRGLQLEGALPKEGAGGGVAPQQPPGGFDPTVNPPQAKPEGYWVRFDRARRRPLFTGGLKAPFDLGVFDDAGKLVEVRSITKAEDVAWPTFSNHAYRHLLLAPLGWFLRNGVQNQTGQILPIEPLSLPGALTRLQPEPERYQITVGGVPAWVEVVMAYSEIYRGLMWRPNLKPNCGMLFVYRLPENHGFWMGNCMFDQTIAYIRSNWTIGSLVDMMHPVLPGKEGDTATEAFSESMSAAATVNLERLPSALKARVTLENANKQVTVKGRLSDGDYADLLRLSGEAEWKRAIGVLQHKSRRPTTEDDAGNIARQFHGSGEPAQFCLEMEQGWYRDQHIAPGAAVEPGPVVLEFLKGAELPK